MAIPSKEAFENFLELTEWKLPDFVAEEIGALKLPTKEVVAKYLNIINELYDKHCQSIDKHEVALWALKQENLKKSYKSLFLRIKPIPSIFKTKAEYLDNRVNRIHEKFSMEDQSAPINHQIDAYLLKLKVSRHVEWFTDIYKPSKKFLLQIGILRCMYNYYHTDRAIQIYKAKINANAILRNTASNLNALINLSNFQEFLVHDDGREHRTLFGNNTKRLIEKINDVNFNFPFNRNDKTLKERVLIYDLDKLFIRYFKESRPNAIFYLLMLEGVENNIEKRGIERMIGMWKTGSKS